MTASFRFHYRIESEPASNDEYEYSVMIDHPGCPTHDDWEELKAIVVKLNSMNGNRLHRTTNP